MALEAPSDRQPNCILREGRCVVHGVTGAAGADSAAVEVRRLQHRVLELETMLAEMQRSAESAAVAAASAPPEVTPVSASDPSLAWIDPEATFEERIAARAFFHHGDVDQPARRWFLGRS